MNMQAMLKQAQALQKDMNKKLDKLTESKMGKFGNIPGLF